ncbi:MAG: MBL fold metallo-hydrolase [Thermodesulfobacteriota bacterium]
MEEIYPDIFMITETGTLGALMPPVNIYVLTGPDGLIFDAGYGRKKILEHLGKELHRIRERVLSRGGRCTITRALPSHSHPDHISGLPYLKREFGVRTLLTEKMAASMSSRKHYYKVAADSGGGAGPAERLLTTVVLKYFQPALLGTRFSRNPDEILGEDAELSVNGEPWRIMPAPGHCDDHIFLYNEARGILFSGDNIMRSVTTWLGPPRSDLKAYERTLEQVLALPSLNLILSAHGSPITDPRPRVRELLDHRAERTREVLALIKGAGPTGLTIKEILLRLYTGAESQKRLFAEGWVRLTLEYLEKRGEVESTGSGMGKAAAYRAVS